jgi:hypothetical protein
VYNDVTPLGNEALQERLVTIAQAGDAHTVVHRIRNSILFLAVLEIRKELGFVLINDLAAIRGLFLEKSLDLLDVLGICLSIVRIRYRNLDRRLFDPLVHLLSVPV